jgi:FlaA1/EpsC-like NDP-sugar epimerase
VGKGGVNAFNEFLNNPNLDLRPVGFIDDDLRNKKKLINGYPVLGTIDSLETILEKNSISEVILSFDHISQEKLDRLSYICLFHQIPLRRFHPRPEALKSTIRPLHNPIILPTTSFSLS